MDSVFIKVWENIRRGRKSDFVRSTKGFTKAELKGRMSQFISNELKSMLTNFAGLFLDLLDLKSTYKDKPEQLEALRAHTNKFVRIVNGYGLFEDMQYQSDSEAL